ncbi:MAG: hypothetical protein KJ077_13950 [Anaerolineae bacterium]|nr:hypothetical protein [Anaerolineae bacterium]
MARELHDEVGQTMIGETAKGCNISSGTRE